ncbi:methyltransferase domain-containing protein [Kribbella yunnanensis]|uniref:Methyltransferase domain-containing protein n=1 Tax=Kribbella yunnanensis TaxID=190194 RepID=A0ABN2HBX3_9ACTN
MEFDWGVGEYERIAVDLVPAAQVLVRAACVGALPEHVVDVGCGTGNVALLAAELGARVTGIEPAARLRELTAAAAAAKGLAVSVLDGTAADIPLPDGSADVVLSNFAVIMAPDAQAAADELARVTASDGRILLTAWTPGGPWDEMMGILGKAVAQATDGAFTPPPKPIWHDPDAATGLLGPHGFKVTPTQHQLTFPIGAPAEFWQTHLERHPIGVHTAPLLQQAGLYDGARADVIAQLTEWIPEFVVDYVVIEAQR